MESDGTPKKGRKRNDPYRFQGVGVNFKGKMIGVQAVGDARGDKMCQEAIGKLKSMVKNTGGHKQKVIINVSLEGLKILDEKSGMIIHTHAVHKISFISRDIIDPRAFGYIYGPGDGSHDFFGIKTEKAAEGLVLTLRDLFQVVFEMKKREVEEARKQKEESSVTSQEQNTQNENAYDQPKQQQEQQQTTDAEAVGNLLNLESELQNLEQGMAQISVAAAAAQQGDPASPGGWSAFSDSSASPSSSQGFQANFGATPYPAQAQEASPPALPPRPEGGLLPAPPGSAAAIAAAQQQQLQQQQQQQKASTGWVAFDDSPPGAGGTTNTASVFATPSAAAVPNQSFSSTQSDPFNSDPFFSSSTPASAAGGGTNQFAAFQDLTSTSTMASSSNPFMESSVFGTTSSSLAPADNTADSTFNNAFDAPEPPVQSLVPGQVARTYKEPRPTTKRDDMFGDLVGFGAEVQPDLEDDEDDGVVLNLGRGGGQENKDFIIVDNAATPATAETESPKKPPPGAVAVLPVAMPASQPVTQPATQPSNPMADLFGATQPTPAADPFVVNTAASQPTAVDLFAGLGGATTTTTSAATTSAPVSVSAHPPLSSTFEANVVDPFDTSRVFLPPKRGPFDTSELLPQALDMLAPNTAAPNGSFTSPDFPSPEAPPPPLPQTVELAEAPPLPPPRPGTSSSIGSTGTPPLRRQHTIDVCLSDSPPPPPPPRLGTSNKPSPTLPVRRQMTVDATFDPPALPPRARPGGKRMIPPLMRADTLPNPPAPLRAAVTQSSVPATTTWKASPEPQRSRGSPVVTDPFAVTLPHGKTKTSKHRAESASSIISRPRPRPRPRTPGSTNSPLSARSYSPHTTDSQHSESPRGSLHEDLERSPKWGERSDTPSSVKSDIVPDPFTHVDPFSKDPFKDQPDPFSLESPSSDPFSSDFNQEQVFHTQAVTADVDPFAEDPFGHDPFGQSSGSQTVSSTSSPGRSTSSPGRRHKASPSHRSELLTAKKDPVDVNSFLGDFIHNQFQTMGTSGTSTTGPSNGANSASTNRTAFSQSEDDMGVTNQNSANWKDGDSSSNSEIGDAFCVDSHSAFNPSAPAGGGSLANGLSSKQQPKPFTQTFHTNNQSSGSNNWMGDPIMAGVTEEPLYAVVNKPQRPPPVLAQPQPAAVPAAAPATTNSVDLLADLFG